MWDGSEEGSFYVLHLLTSFERCEDSRCRSWRPVGQSPWTARDPLVALSLAITQPSIVWLWLRRSVHYQPSIDALSWASREARYKKKFD